MTDRMIDLSEEPVHLSVRHAQLVIERQARGDVTVPLNELGVLVVSHPQVSLTHAVLSRLSAAGGAVVVCDQKHLPVGMMLPLQGHFAQAERFAQQARASRPTCKRLWQQIVRSKIRAQSRLLSDLHDDDRGLSALVSRVRSGDPENVEAQASRRYWPALFQDPGFRRRPEGEDQNRLLNYGYAVLRAIIARAICAAGLHPSLGLHHHNRYDLFCLADDLMEPLRPVVDRAVIRCVQESDANTPLDRQAKQALLSALTGRFEVQGEWRSLFDVVGRLASSLAAVFAGERQGLILPEI